MFLPFVMSAAGAAGSHLATKASERAEAERKLEAAKRVLGLTPDQAAQIDALKGKSADEAEAHAALGIDFRNPLPPQASERAREVRAALQAGESPVQRAQKERLAAAVAAEKARLTPQEEAAIRSAPPEQRDKVIDAITEKKTEEASSIINAALAISENRPQPQYYVTK